MLSKRYRAINPLCEDCGDRERVTPASEVHHIVPILRDPSKRLDWNNLVALCHGCHVQRHRDLGDR
ncbi:MAG: HNH endonuclease signature motif containing protein [Pirellulales bacterium]